MADILTDVQFWQQVLTDAERTVVVSPELEERCKRFVRERGLEHLIEVRASDLCNPGQILVLDLHVIEAAARQTLQGWGIWR